MRRFLYSIIRYVPDVARQEFFNVGVTVADATDAFWIVSSDKEELQHIEKILGPLNFDLAETILDTLKNVLNETHLQLLPSKYHGIIQFSTVFPILADSLEEAADKLYERLVKWTRGSESESESETKEPEPEPKAN